MQVIEVDGGMARVEQEGVTRKVRVDFIPDLQPGDYVLIHAGIAIERVNAEEAAETLRLIKEIVDAIP